MSDPRSNSTTNPVLVAQRGQEACAMLHRRTFLIGALAASVGGIPAYADALADETIHAILAKRIGIERESSGIVAVVSDAAGSRLFTYGSADNADNRPLDGDTVFEIGSITKVLTALILVDMVERGEVAMNDPVANYLPSSVKVPEYKGKPITLLDLATYTSGLPNTPNNFAPKNRLNPWADYTVDQLYTFLSGTRCITSRELIMRRQSRLWLTWPRAGAPRGQNLRGAFGGAYLRPARSPKHSHHTDRRYAIAHCAGSQRASGTHAAMGYPDAGWRRRRAFDCE